ncbi:MAG: putative DNA binding domain-containing protein [Chlamydiae bacterium]|nr:putative DNA binding domain-containing protein [Chlamydiota bacterium]MBI3277240.1 putative DNA binding domain-containing protein [Chlamydiota bacterium]
MPLDISSVLKEGKGQKIEFKEGLSFLAPEFVAFANASGGRLYVGITDRGEVHPTALTNRLKSQITDIARNCDPPIEIKISQADDKVITVEIPEGKDKPYKCKEGCFLRIGPNTQKLKRDEIVQLIQHAGKIHFDELINERFIFQKDFDKDEWEKYRKLAGYPSNIESKDALVNIGVASHREKKILLTNAALLFFAKNPQQFFPEASVTCLKYRGQTRYDIIDRYECKGNILKQLEETLTFFGRYNARQIKITGAPRHEEWEDYPSVAIREAVINALIHRDYLYDISHIYLHIYDGHLELDNPGGFIRGLSLEDLGSKAARRNRMLADLMQRAGYIENAGTGILRIQEALKRNNNPPAQISATNFFSLRLIARPKNLTEDDLTDRQRKLYAFLTQRGKVSTTDCTQIMGVGSDTILSELKALLLKNLIQKTGKGKNTRYFI